MQLPDELVTRIKADGGHPQVAVRALYDLDGNLGETFVAADNRTLWLFWRRFGEPFQTLRLSLAEISELKVAAQSVFIEMGLTTSSAAYALKFSSWDKPQLDALAGLWSAGRPAPKPTRETPLAVFDQPGPELSPADGLTPVIAYCAAMRLMMAADTALAVHEQEHLRGAGLAERTIRMGENYLQTHGREQVLSRLGAVLNGEQKTCLMSHLIAMATADGALKPSEEELLRRFRQALGLAE